MKRATLTILTLLLVATSYGRVDFTKIDKEKINSSTQVFWRQFGPGGSGNNFYIYPHPTRPETFFQGPNMGNAYLTTDGGKSYIGILDCDGTSGRSLSRGPAEIMAVEFSRQSPDYGLCSCENIPSVFITKDGGVNWELQERASQIVAQNRNFVSTIKVDPTNDRVWYMGSGHIKDANRFHFTEKNPHGRFDVNAEGIATIWKSSDRGESWRVITPKGLPADGAIAEIFVHPSDGNKIFAATTYGLYISKNGGKSWEHKVGRGLDNDIIRSMDMHYDKESKAMTLVAIDLVKYTPRGKTVDYNGGLFISKDEGESWQKINNNLPVDKKLLEGRLVKMSYYTLNLAKWFGCKPAEAQSRFPELPEKILQSFSEVRINPSNPKEMMLINNYKSQYTFAGGMLWRTTNGGESWEVTLRNGTRWEGADKAYWESRNNPTSYNITLRAQAEWGQRDEYDRKAGATIAYSSDGKMIMFQFAKVVCVSYDSGATWLENDEVDASDNNSECWIGAGNSNMPGSEIVQDMRLKDKFYLCAGENSIWQTTKDGEAKFGIEYQSLKKILMPNAVKTVECSTGSMAVDPRDTNILYSTHYRQAFAGKVMKSDDGGANWRVHGSLYTVPKEEYNSAHVHVNHLTIDPNFPDRFYVALPRRTINDMAGQGSSKFFREYGFYGSMDGGVTFKMMNNGLTNTDVQQIAISPREKGVVYCAVMSMGNKPGGLFRLANGETTWKRVATPNNMTSVHDIYFAQDGKMYITGGTINGSTKDGGVWYTTDNKIWKQVFPYKIANHIRVAKYDPKVLLVSVQGTVTNAVKNPGIYRSLDGGQSWEKINAGNIQSDRLSDLQIDFFRPGLYYTSTYGAGYYKAVDKSLIK